MPHKTDGVALPVVLVLMLVLTILGVSGLRMAQAHFRMAGAVQFHVAATEAAESAIAEHFEEGAFATGPVGQEVAGSTVSLGGSVSALPGHRYHGSGPIPAGGASMANNAFSAYHFELRATGSAPANSEVEVVQGIYIVAPGGN